MLAREQIDVLEAIHSTPARRYLRSDPIADDVLWEILDAAIRGPTGGNVQNWGWVVVQDAGLKETIAASYRSLLLEMYGYESYPEEGLGGDKIVLGQGVVPGAQIGIDSRNRAAVVHLAEHMHEAPVLILPVIRLALSFEDTWDGGAGAGSFIYGAVQNLLLAARAYGIGGVFTAGPGPLRSWGVDRLLGLPDDARAMALIPLGYPAQGRWAQPRRRPVEQVVHWDAWGTKRRRKVTTDAPTPA